MKKTLLYLIPFVSIFIGTVASDFFLPKKSPIGPTDAQAQTCVAPTLINCQTIVLPGSSAITPCPIGKVVTGLGQRDISTDDDEWITDKMQCCNLVLQ